VQRPDNDTPAIMVAKEVVFVNMGHLTTRLLWRRIRLVGEAFLGRQAFASCPWVLDQEPFSCR
jgi:hypothetical protein